MKLRQLPEDFKVEEINEFKIQKEGKYRLYTLQKQGMETFALVAYISKKYKIPSSYFGIAGLKDKHALTIQYMTLPEKYALPTQKEKNFSLTFLGFVDKALVVGDLQGNKFEITVRDVHKGELAAIIHRAQELAQMGVPNYFDSQRFGSVINGKFIAQYIVHKEYENAVKLYLTQYTHHESAQVKQEKKALLSSWGKLDKVYLRHPQIKTIVAEYLRTKNWLKTYLKIPRNLREMYVSAYQSYLWNKSVEQVLRQKYKGKNLYPIEYAVGKLLFYKGLGAKDVQRLPPTLPLLCPSTPLLGLEGEIISSILAQEGIILKQLDIQKETGNFFKQYERAVILKPTDFTQGHFIVDELNDKGRGLKYKVTLTFTLPKGSYATIITKKIFNH